MTWIIIVIALAIIIFILLLLRLKIKIYYRLQKNNHHLLVSIYYARVRVIHRKVDLSGDEQKDYSIIFDLLQDMTEEKMTSFRDVFQTIIQQFKLAKNILLTMLNKITFQELNWKTHIGTGDASTTGLVTGGAWIVKGGLLGVVYELSNFDCKPELAITPHFQQRGLFSEVDCIVTIRLGKAIYTALKVIRSTNIFPSSKWQIDSY